jgi:tetratricopeptide (TPR) repeat protein
MAYYPHNIHFRWFSAMFDGQSKVALESAHKVAAKISDEVLAELPLTAGFRVVPYWSYLRFGLWDDILREPAPPATNDFLTGAWHYARGQALVATNRLSEAEQELAKLQAVMARESLDQPLFSPNTGRAILQIGPPMLAGEIAAARGDFSTAVNQLELAVRLEDALVYTEPAEWAFPSRHALGAVLLQAGRAAEAETIYWEDLKRNRDNGWGLTGLALALEAQDKKDLAVIVRQRLEKAFERADLTVTGSRFGRPAAPAGATPASGGN